MGFNSAFKGLNSWSDKFRCASGSAGQSFASETGQNQYNFYPKIVDVSVEIQTGHIVTTIQALLLDSTCLCNQEGLFGAALLGELYGVKQKEYGDSPSVRPSVVTEPLSDFHEIWWKNSLQNSSSKASFVNIGAAGKAVPF
jgi:hypothetical protein